MMENEPNERNRSLPQVGEKWPTAKQQQFDMPANDQDRPMNLHSN